MAKITRNSPLKRTQLIKIESIFLINLSMVDRPGDGTSQVGRTPFLTENPHDANLIIRHKSKQ